VLDAAIGDEQIGTMLRTTIGRDRMRAAWAECRERLPRDHGQLSMLDGWYATGALKVPAGAPAGFVPTNWADYLVAPDGMSASSGSTRTRKTADAATMARARRTMASGIGGAAERRGDRMPDCGSGWSPVVCGYVIMIIGPRQQC
jgi:hypothetical protein